MKMNAVGVAASRFVRELFILGAATALFTVATAPRLAHGQLAPEIGYSLPAGGSAGTTFEMTIGGYDWTPDMQLFAHDPRVKIELIGQPSRVLVPEPPYWFGAKARGPAWPLAREFRAKVTIPADVKPGLVKWQAANANGASPAGWLHVSTLPEFVEDPKASGPQPLPTLPLVVSGQIRKIEEVDRFVVKVPAAGPVTLRLLARQLGSPLHGILRVHDAEGRVVVDVADAEGRDFDVTFAAAANSPYTVSLHDLDFAGDRSYFYRLEFHQGPRVTAAYPATGKRGETRSVEFVGWGVATGAAKLESIVRDVAFPADSTLDSFEFGLTTPHGRAPDFRLGLSDVADEVAPPGAEKHALPRVPVAITGALETRFGADT
ncbi:MAG TPA: hypothetical protein PLV92_14095, partial [Pirellulaceae bacterium]|nr:hypothetical protein [Pirellulaceae bacterium]